MAIKQITTFTGDSWKKQKEESDRAHHYFKQYKKKNLSKKKFKQLLLEEADERSVKGQVKFWGPDATFNKQHQKEIQQFIDTNGKQGQCPKPCGAVEDWFDFHKWFTRKQDFTNFSEEEADLLIRDMITEEKPQIAKEIIQNIKDLNLLRRKLQSTDKLTLSQDESGAKATNMDIDSLRKLSNSDVQKLDVVADVEAKAEVEAKANISQDIILKPEYVELTRKLLEDVVNDS